jgi:hypothetical protein
MTSIAHQETASIAHRIILKLVELQLLGPTEGADWWWIGMGWDGGDGAFLGSFKRKISF